MRADGASAKYDPWQHEYRRVAAEVERTGNQSLFADFQRRFLWLWRCSTHLKRMRAGEARYPR